MDRKRLKVLMKLEVDMDSITSKCTAVVLRQAKMTTHLLTAHHQVVTLHGPKTSSPT